jgi:DNA repair protein SbcC/Rad50
VFCVICGSILLPVGQAAYSQFAALVRDRQVAIAEHERTLFDYVTLELSPTFPGDSLIASRSRGPSKGKAVVTPRVFGFEDDRAIAA